MTPPVPAGHGTRAAESARFPVRPPLPEAGPYGAGLAGSGILAAPLRQVGLPAALTGRRRRRADDEGDG
jgi:hypothetical protein